MLTEAKSSKALTACDLASAYWKFVGPLKSALKSFLAIYANTPASQFGRLMLIAYQNSPVKSGICRKYINQQVGRIKRMFKWGVSRELVLVEVHQAISTVAGLRVLQRRCH